ncbi:MAG: hypothetical protein NTAFB01_43370 [Nitrospira sp.]
MRTEEGNLSLFVAIDRTSKFAYAELHEQYGKMEAAQFLRTLIATVPYTIHTILTDTGIPFTTRQTDRYAFPPIFARVCLEHDTAHRLTKPNHPWTNGQVERMNRTRKEATVKRDDYENHQQLREHLSNFLNAYNFAKRLKPLQGLTPYESSSKAGKTNPNAFSSTQPITKWG